MAGSCCCTPDSILTGITSVIGAVGTAVSSGYKAVNPVVITNGIAVAQPGVTPVNQFSSFVPLLLVGALVLVALHMRGSS